MIIRILTTVLVLGWAAAASAHESRPAFLDIRQTGPEHYDVTWKVPATGDDMRLAVYVRFDEQTANLTEPVISTADGWYTERWSVTRPNGLPDSSIEFLGLAFTKSEVLVRFEASDGSAQMGRATAGAPSFTIGRESSFGEVAATYLVIGVEHIWFGIDHLLFVLALLLLINGFRNIAKAVTAFTVAHSVTLALATLGLVNIPVAPVEVMIALSIVLVAAEVLRPADAPTTFGRKHSWMVAFAFGLLHGLGFAGALSDVGLPRNAIPEALLFFNVGVEAGQLAFVLAILLVARLSLPFASQPRLQIARVAVTYAIGTIAAFWAVERLGGFLLA